jgi:ATP-dependent DNA helicase RecG
MRPEILFPLYAPAASLKGVGPRLAPLVEKSAGPRVKDLLFTLPQSTIARPRLRLADARPGDVGVFVVDIVAHREPERRGRPYRIMASDGSAEIALLWFRGFGPHLGASHPPGVRRAVSGKLESHNGLLTLAHPDYFVDESKASSIPVIEPVYPVTAGLSSRTLRRIVLEALARAPDLPEWLDERSLLTFGWPRWRDALGALHGEQAEAGLSLRSPARLRLAYDELLAHQLAMGRRKAAVASEAATPAPASSLADAARASLPYQLTGAQARTLEEIRRDLASGLRMSRIVQGDVGSGKTIVALLAMIDIAAAGGQSALMAPTEILARQHFETIAESLKRAGLTAMLLTGRDKGPARQSKLEALRSGAAAVAVGTHALFQDDVTFRALRLAIIDEQHRFGVRERGRLQSKGEAVHMLALSATPIPRTLELTVFGDLDVSRIDEKPPGRKPVLTTAAPTTRLGAAVDRLRAAVRDGAQAFWICPLVEENETLDVTAAEVRAAALQAAIGDGVGLIHGRLAGAEKDRVMAAFAAGKIAVLVATTVVEVGVNVPNARIMVIEHAERFGLAQLHQLRGRVGRGEAASACLLLYDPPLSASAKARLEVLRETDDGFVIAERDLELRGGGDLLGRKQSGFPAYRFADPDAHRDLLSAAAEDARAVLAGDPGFSSPRGAALRVLESLHDWTGEAGWASGG